MHITHNLFDFSNMYYGEEESGERCLRESHPEKERKTDRGTKKNGDSLFSPLSFAPLKLDLGLHCPRETKDINFWLLNF